jgi:hypothetical protein
VSLNTLITKGERQKQSIFEDLSYFRTFSLQKHRIKSYKTNCSVYIIDFQTTVPSSKAPAVLCKAVAGMNRETAGANNNNSTNNKTNQETQFRDKNK